MTDDFTRELLNLATTLLVLIGSLLMLIAALGVVRMPDVFTRCQAAAKAATLGVGLCIAAVAFHFDDLTVDIRAVLVSFFFLITAPVAGSVISRAAYRVGTPLWEGTVVDELGEHERRETDGKGLPTP